MLALLCVVSSVTRVRGVYERTDLGTNSIVLLASVVLVGTDRRDPRRHRLLAARDPPGQAASVWAMNTALFALLGAAAGLRVLRCSAARDDPERPGARPATC